MKMNFQAYQEEANKKEKFFSSIDNKIYSKEDLEYQRNLLEYIEREIKECYKKGKTIEETKNFIKGYVFSFVRLISRPSFFDFYITRAMEYLVKNEDILKKNVTSFIVENKDIKKVIEKQKNTTENVDINIEIAIAIILNGFKDFTHVKPGKFTEIQTKISENKLSINDIDDTVYYVKKMMEQYIGNNVFDFYRWMKKNPGIVYQTLKNSVSDIFEVKELVGKNGKVDLDTLLHENHVKNNKVDFMLEEKKWNRFIEIKDFLENPLYSRDKKSNILIFLNDMLEKMKYDDLEFLYNLFEDIKNNKDSKNKEKILQEVFEKAVRRCRPEEDRELYLNRIFELLKLQEITGCYEKFNSLNNERLKSLGLEKLVLDDDELEKAVLSLENKEIDSTEKEIAMSAFYANRAAKIVPYLARASFIVERNNVFEKIYENPNFEIGNIEISDEKISEGMALFDGISEYIKKEKVLNYSKAANNKDAVDEKKLGKLREIYKTKYDNFSADLHNVVTNMKAKELFYTLKDSSISALIFTAVTTSSKNIVNWGYVPGDKNLDKRNVLIGFDVEGLNMPIYFHISKQKLSRIMGNVTGQKTIPVYEGAVDFKILERCTKMATTLVLYPTTKKQRKVFKKELSTKNNNPFIEHLKWLQDSKAKPQNVNTPGIRMYDIEKGVIFSKKVDQDYSGQGKKAVDKYL